MYEYVFCVCVCVHAYVYYTFCGVCMRSSFLVCLSTLILCMHGCAYVCA